MTTQAAMTEASAALREFLSEHLGAEEMRQASKLIAAYVAAAVNDRPRVIREREEAEARRERAIRDAKDHHRRTKGPFAGSALQEALDHLSTLTAELHRHRPAGQPIDGCTQGKA